MEIDDDIVMIIVGDDTALKQPIKVKEEVENDDQVEEAELEDPLLHENVEQYLEAAEKYGEVVPVDFIKQEFDESRQGGATETEEEPDYLEDFSMDEDECLSKISKKLTKTKTVAAIRNTPDKKTPNSETNSLRRRMLRPDERKSYVRDLRIENPELQKNQQLLIEELAKIMRSTKPPPPPDGFCHTEETEETTRYVCETCGFLAATIGGISRHYQLMHGERYLVCYACGVDFRDITNLYKHEKKCNSPDAVVVLKARAIAVGFKGRARPYLPSKEELERNRKELEKHQAKSRMKCSYCPATFAAPLALDAHENLHRGERPYLCDCCMAPYGSYPALVRHRKNHDGIQYICDTCGGSFISRITLQAHLKTHNPARKYACAMCDKRYAQKMALVLHIRRVHENLPPPCACQLCPKRYARNSLLKIHMKKTHGLDLITRNMFIKSLPRLTDMELEQAKVVMKSDLATFPHVVPLLSDLEHPYYTTKRVPKHIRNETHKGRPRRIEYEEKITMPINKHKKKEEVIPTPITKHEFTEQIPSNNENIDNEEHNSQMVIVPKNEEVNENQIIVDISDTDLSAEVLLFVQKLQAENKEKVVLLDHGKVVHLVDSESEALKLMEELQSKQGSVEIEDISEYIKANQACSDVSDEAKEKIVFYNDIPNAPIELTKLQLSVNPEIAKQQIMDTIEAQLREMEEDSASTNTQEKLEYYETSPTNSEEKLVYYDETSTSDAENQEDYKIVTEVKAEEKENNKQRKVEMDVAELRRIVSDGQKEAIEVSLEIEKVVKKEKINKVSVRTRNKARQEMTITPAPQKDYLKSNASQTGTNIPVSQKGDIKVAETQEDDTMTVSQNDDTIAAVSQNYDAIATVSQNDDTIAAVSQNDDAIATVSQNDDTIAAVSQYDDTLAVASQNGDIIAAVSQNDDTIDDVSQNDDKIAAVSQNNDTVAAVSQNDDAIAAVSQNDDTIAAVSQNYNTKADMSQKNEIKAVVTQKTRTSLRKRKINTSETCKDTDTTDIDNKNDSEANVLQDGLKSATKGKKSTKEVVTQKDKIKAAAAIQKDNSEVVVSQKDDSKAVDSERDDTNVIFAQNNDIKASTSQKTRTRERTQKTDKNEGTKIYTEITDTSQIEDDAVSQKECKKSAVSQKEDSQATALQTVVLHNTRTNERKRKIDISETTKADTEIPNASHNQKDKAVSQNDDSKATVSHNTKTTDKKRKIYKNETANVTKVDTEMTDTSQKLKTDAKNSDNNTSEDENNVIKGLLRRSRRAKGNSMPEI